MPLSTSEPNEKETSKGAKILSPTADASVNIVIYNKFVINVNLRSNETKPET